MQDVAAVAGVSLKSVSRVVNREDGVSPRLFEKVTAAVTELGYRHNLAASNLRRGQRTGSIGMVVQDLSNDYCSGLLRAVEDRARTRGVVVMVSSTDEDGGREKELVAGLAARRIDGLILMSTGADLSWLQADLDSGLVVVAVDRRPRVPALDCVLIDNEGSARHAVRHLIEHGHRRIGYLGDAITIATAQDRLDGYRAALREAGIAPDPVLERIGLRSTGPACTAVHELLALPDPPTAIFSARNTVSEGAVLGLREAGLSRDVALVGFDDFAAAHLVDPEVTIVQQDTYEIGTRAIDLLLARIDGDDSPLRVETVPTTLIARGSGEILGPFAATG